MESFVVNKNVMYTILTTLSIPYEYFIYLFTLLQRLAKVSGLP